MSLSFTQSVYGNNAHKAISEKRSAHLSIDGNYLFIDKIDKWHFILKYSLSFQQQMRQKNTNIYLNIYLYQYFLDDNVFPSHATKKMHCIS